MTRVKDIPDAVIWETAGGICCICGEESYPRMNRCGEPVVCDECRYHPRKRGDRKEVPRRRCRGDDEIMGVHIAIVDKDYNGHPDWTATEMQEEVLKSDSNFLLHGGIAGSGMAAGNMIEVILLKDKLNMTEEMFKAAASSATLDGLITQLKWISLQGKAEFLPCNDSDSTWKLIQDFMPGSTWWISLGRIEWVIHIVLGHHVRELCLKADYVQGIPPVTFSNEQETKELEALGFDIIIDNDTED